MIVQQLRSISGRTSSVAIHRVCAMSFSGGSGWGSGAGHGGGSGGSVRDAGGSFGKMEAAREEEYFRRLQRLQLKDLKASVEHEIKHHEAEIRRHEEAIERHKKRQHELDHEAKQI